MEWKFIYEKFLKKRMTHNRSLFYILTHQMEININIDCAVCLKK